MPWQALLALSILFLSLNGLFHKSLLKGADSDPRAQAIVFLGLGGIFALLISLARGKFNLSFSPPLVPYFIVLAIFLTLAYVLKYRSFQLLDASEVTIFSATGRIWNVLGSAILLHETVTINKVLGTLIILAGITITCFNQGKFKINQGIFYVLLGAFFFGITDIIGYFILQTMDASNYQIYASFLPVLTLLLVQPKAIKKVRYYFSIDKGLKLGLLTICDVLGMLFLFFAYQVGRNASVIGPLSATKVIITVLLAAIILRERNNLASKIVGAIVTVLGVALLL